MYTPDDREPLVAVDAPLAVNVFQALKPKPTKIRDPHGDLRASIAELIYKKVSMTKVKSHLTLDDHLAKGGEAWAWHANNLADELAVVTALSIAPFVTKETND